MPELPEVQTIVRTLQPLVGRRLGRTVVLRRDVVHGEAVDFSAFTQRRTIQAITRRAKRIYIDTGAGRQIMIHLGMTGRLTVSRRGAELAPHTHLRIRLAGGDDELRFCDVRRFGGVWLLGPATPAGGRGLGELGPDPLAMTWPQFRDVLRRRRQIKALLLDQTAIAGLGNIYADESLFAAGIHPQTRASDLGESAGRRLYRAVRRTLQAAIRAGGSTIRDYRDGLGENGWFQLRHRVYGREGRPCRRCRSPIQRLAAAGRSSHVCPACQQLK